MRGGHWVWGRWYRGYRGNRRFWGTSGARITHDHDCRCCSALGATPALANLYSKVCVWFDE